MSIYAKQLLVAGLGMFLLLQGRANVNLQVVEREGWTTIEMENSLLKVVLIPDMARFPYSFVYKPTGRDFMVHPKPLSTPVPEKGDKFVYYGGLIDCIPWVSGIVDGKRLPVKGYLHFTKWEYTTGQTEGHVWFDGFADVTYTVPYTTNEAVLRVRKKMTLHAGSAVLRMDYTIENIGTNDAVFTFDIHARSAINEWDKGDYFWAPGKKTFVYELHRMEKLEKRGIKLFTWTDWPVPEVVELDPSPETSYVFTYTPANWCVIGDPNTKEALFFVSSPIRYRDRKDIMKMGIFRTNQAYVVQPCLSYALQVTDEIWNQPGATVTLPEGEKCEFTMDLAGYQGVEKNDVFSAIDAMPECVLLETPSLVQDGSKIRLSGRLAFAAHGSLFLMSGADVMKEVSVQPGIFDLGDIGGVFSARGGPVVIEFVSGMGRSVLCRF